MQADQVKKKQQDDKLKVYLPWMPKIFSLTSNDSTNRSLYFLPKLTMSILDWFHGLTVAVTFTDHILLIRVFWTLALCLIRCNNHVCHHKESSIFLGHKEFIVSRNTVYLFFAINVKSTKFFFPSFLALFCFKKYPYSSPQRFIGLNSPIPLKIPV